MNDELKNVPVLPSEFSRRAFLSRFIAKTAALAVLLNTIGKRVWGTATLYKRPPSTGAHPSWGMVIDLDKCTGCGSCVVACSVENNQMLGSAESAAMGRIIRWLKILPTEEGEYPSPKQKLIPMPCQQCDDPPCTRVCPVYATFKNEEGIVGQVYARCIGCRYCLNACPYTCKFFNWSAPTWPKEMAQSLNPDVSVRPKGVTEKCLFCHHRLQRAKEDAAAEGRPLRAGDYQPACAEVCPAKAIVFGDLRDREGEVYKLSRDARVFRLLENLGTEPKVAYLRGGD